ncbi:glycine oxidase ThiO [Halomonas beimenensis]|uniref:Glycine oxidase ThiO n=1 Tax=Halomonas beimenensis TaxID=475662 RepID=A0A291P9M0_9GAMM|nr:glycine oxidase ThiO [Halomonas beimenensis]ATJ83574.1 glycine oxidase ThiO [Halomonas beimenensis]
MKDFLIIGGGVIGMMTAWQLAEAGHEVTLVERGPCGGEASWAGGGIVSPLYPWRHPAPISQLASWSEGRYPHLTAHLAEATGIDPEFRRQGLLYLDLEDAPQAMAWAGRVDKPLSRVDAYAVYAREPRLTEGLEGGLWMPTLGSLRNPRLGQALRARLQALPGITLHEHCPVERLVVARGRIHGVDTAAGRFTAGRVILCGGAWTGQLLAPLGIALPVRPVKGQMMVFRTPTVTGSRQWLERVVLRGGRYLIPRADGRVLVGSTLEEAGFDKTPTPEARASLHASAVSILPALAECEVEHHWSGLRPGAPDGLPFIGEIPGVAGLFVNAGHYRNGLVLAPAATRLLVDELLGRAPILDPTPFRPAARLAAAEPLAATG